MLSVITRLLTAKHRPLRPPSLPDGMRLYVVGDVHGRDDLLAGLLEGISEDLSAHPDVAVPQIVILGDLVDRGPDSRAVLDRLLSEPTRQTCPPVTVLRGNHEQMLLDALLDDDAMVMWLNNGGGATLASYGVTPVIGAPTRERVARAREAFRTALPASHLEFLSALPVRLHLGDYFLVHAGIRPGVALAEQSETDMIWIRDRFLANRTDFGAVIIHGHNITPAPDLRPNRIGIDTGAYCMGVLSCLVLEGQECRLIQASAQGIRKSALPPR